MIPIKKIYLLIAVFGVISTLLFVFVVLPLFKEIQAISQNLFLKKNKIVYLTEERENIKKIENVYKTYQSDLDRIENLFVDPEVPIEFIGFLEKTAAGSQIKLEIFSMIKKTEQEPWQSLSAQLLVTGSFSNFSKFLHKLENGPYLIEVLDVNTKKLTEREIQVGGLENIPEADTITTFSIKAFTK
jgi:Tfp pilus assembly protein PilO